MARVGPELRSPIGGYFAAAAKARACSSVSIIGAMTASAPMSSARLTMPLSPTATRTIAGLPASATPVIERMTETGSCIPCCMSMVTLSKPLRAQSSATTGSGIELHAVLRVSPAFSRAASVGAGMAAAAQVVSLRIWLIAVCINSSMVRRI